MAKKKVEETINLETILFNCRNHLRSARNSGSFFEKRDMMLTLVFLRFIGEKYEDGIANLRQMLINEGLDPDDEDIRAAFFDDATFADGTYNLPPEARWSTIINTPAPQLNVALDTALNSIDASSKQLQGCFIKGTFTTRNLAPNDIKKIVDEVNKISHKAFGEEKDLIGRVYEYFLKEFAVNATKEEGEFYTPHDVVQLIATMIEPFDGTLYDPCCGSGGMFIQSAELVREKKGDISRINVYGQEITLEQGINIEKRFITPQRSNDNFYGRKIVRTGQIAYCTQLNNENVAVALRTGPDCIVSGVYDVIEMNPNGKLLPEYLMLWLIRSEFGRFVYWASQGTSYEFLTYENLANYKIPIPDIEIQKAITGIYSVYTTRRMLSEKLKK